MGGSAGNVGGNTTYQLRGSTNLHCMYSMSKSTSVAVEARNIANVGFQRTQTSVDLVLTYVRALQGNVKNGNRHIPRVGEGQVEDVQVAELSMAIAASENRIVLVC